MNPPQPVHFFRLLVGSFLIFASSVVISNTIEWTDHFQGFVSSPMDVFLFGYFWLIFIFPLNLIVGGLYRWRRWRNGRTWFVLAPSFFVFAVMVFGEIIEPPTAHARFEKVTEMPMPASAQNIQHYFRGLGIGGIDEFFYFTCSPADTRLLIKNSHLALNEGGNPDYGEELRSIGFPNPQSWPNLKTYSFDDPKDGLITELMTDGANRQVLLHFVGD